MEKESPVSPWVIPGRCIFSGIDHRWETAPESDWPIHFSGIPAHIKITSLLLDEMVEVSATFLLGLLSFWHHIYVCIEVSIFGHRSQLVAQFCVVLLPANDFKWKPSFKGRGVYIAMHFFWFFTSRELWVGAKNFFDNQRNQAISLKLA